MNEYIYINLIFTNPIWTHTISNTLLYLWSIVAERADLYGDCWQEGGGGWYFMVAAFACSHNSAILVVSWLCRARWEIVLVIAGAHHEFPDILGLDILGLDGAQWPVPSSQTDMKALDYSPRPQKCSVGVDSVRYRRFQPVLTVLTVWTIFKNF